MALNLVYPFLAALLWGTVLTLIKDTKTPSVYGMGIGMAGGAIFLSLFFFLFRPPDIFSGATPPILLIIALVGLTRYVLATWFMYESIKAGDLSVTTPVLGFKIIMVSILSALLGLEKISILLAIAILLASAGFLFITIHIRRLERISRKKLIKAVIFALSAAFCWSVADILVKEIKYISPFGISFGSLIFSLLLYCVYILSSKKIKVVFTMPGFDKRRYFSHGMLSFGLTYFLLNLSLIRIGVIKTNIIIASWPLFASLVGYIWYKEELLFSKKCGAALLIISCMLAGIN